TLPDTLNAQHTDTDTLYAVTSLVKVVKAHAGEAWADKLMAGRFGTLVPKVEAAVNESIAASNALAVAREQRADAFQPAYGKFLAFKRVVRDTLGASSVYYRRLNPRGASNAVNATDGDESPNGGVVPAGNGAPAEVDGPSQAKAG